MTDRTLAACLSECFDHLSKFEGRLNVESSCPTLQGTTYWLQLIGDTFFFDLPGTQRAICPFHCLGIATVRSDVEARLAFCMEWAFAAGLERNCKITRDIL
jgi:hypothetical protein